VNRQDLAFLFPGQGSQAVGMLAGFGANRAVAEAVAAASGAIGLDIAGLVAEGPAETLNLTVNTQPVMLACAVGFFQAYRAAGGPMPSAMAGHSLGEYSALVAAGALPLSEAASLVRFRAEAMQQAVPVGQGGMAAVLGLASQKVEEVCRGLSRPQAVVEAVNFNAPDQTVIAGHLAAVEAACGALKAAGAKRALMLPVSAPFHSSLLAPAAQFIRHFLPRRPRRFLIDSHRWSFLPCRYPSGTTSMPSPVEMPRQSGRRWPHRPRAPCSGHRRSRDLPRLEFPPS